MGNRLHQTLTNKDIQMVDEHIQKTLNILSLYGNTKKNHNYIPTGIVTFEEGFQQLSVITRKDGSSNALLAGI